jgi:hypothetical protein
MCSIILEQINFPAMHNFPIYDHKTLDKTRSILQKIGIDLDDFSILYDFMKFGKKFDIKMDQGMENVEGTCENGLILNKRARWDSNLVQI